jgi:hypothetical protein
VSEERCTLCPGTRPHTVREHRTPEDYIPAPPSAAPPSVTVTLTDAQRRHLLRYCAVAAVATGPYYGHIVCDICAGISVKLVSK